MKKIAKQFLKLTLGLLLIAGAGCGEMLDNPTVDNETGEDIRLLVLDFNFFTTRMNFRLVDNETSNPITKQAKIWFTGNNANDIVDFAGEKHTDFSTSQGQMELTTDPNVDISSTSPFEYAVHVEIDGYEPFSQGIQINAEGKKTFELSIQKEAEDDTVLTGEEDGDSFVFSVIGETLKAATIDANYKINYRITKADLLKVKNSSGRIFQNEDELMAAYEKDTTNFISISLNTNTIYKNKIDRIYVDGVPKIVSFQKLEAGKLTMLNLNKTQVTDLNGAVITQIATSLEDPEPEIFGFVSFDEMAWKNKGKIINHTDLYFNYILAKATEEEFCSLGATIKFSSDAISSFSIDADIYNADGDKILTTNFKGKFPESFTLENVPQIPATIKFRDNNPSFNPISDLKVDNLCSSDLSINVTAADEYVAYQVVLEAYCENNPSFSIAPTYSAEISLKGDTIWQGIDMESGVVDILAKKDSDYELHILWNGQYETANFSTKFDEEGNYINTTGSEVLVGETEDKRKQFLIKHTFEQDICDDLNWK